MKDFEKKNYYELLRVEQNASEEEIKLAFKEIALVYHPDSNFFSEIVTEDNLSESDSNLFKAITTAYQTLSNKQKRNEYDAKLKKENLSKGVNHTDDWIRPDGKTVTGTKPRERAPTVTDLQNLQKRYQERSQVQMKSVADIMHDDQTNHSNNNYKIVIVGVIVVIVIAIILIALL